MPVASEEKALHEIPLHLAELLSVVPETMDVQRNPSSHDNSKPRLDILVDVAGFSFAVEWRSSNALPSIASGIDTLRQATGTKRNDVIPLLAVPYMTPTGTEHCENAEVSWLDLSGNAHIVAPGLRIHVEGKPNQYTRRGRPSNIFAPKSSRVARHLLRFPDRTFLQKEIAQQTGLSEGYTSRVVGRLEEVRLLYRDDNGRVGVRDPDLLLDSWHEKYAFEKHHIQRGTVAAHSGEELLHKVAKTLTHRDISYATTGLSGAWLVDGFASFRTATFYLRTAPTDEDLQALNFHEGSRGANLWLVMANDEGIFHGVDRRRDIVHVHPLQIYLDLKGHPERSDEAGSHLRKTTLQWSSDD